MGLTETWIRPEDSASPSALFNNLSFSHSPHQVGWGEGTGLLISNNWKYSTHSPLCNYNSFESHAITVIAHIKLMLFVHYSSAFNTIVPATLVAKLQTPGLNRSLCSWILDFLTGRSQVVRMGNNTSSPLILNTGAPQGCILSPLLYSLYTHDCTATHSSNVIVTFADDTTVISLNTNNDETAYREEVSTLTKWCQENHLSLNIDKTKELVVDYRRQSREHTPITIDKTPVEQVNSFKFLGDLT